MHSPERSTRHLHPTTACTVRWSFCDSGFAIMVLKAPFEPSGSQELQARRERDNLGFRVYGGPNPASKCVGETIYHWRTGWKRRTRGTITRFSVEAVQPNCPSDPREFARPIYRVDYDARDREELEESEVRILLRAEEPDTIRKIHGFYSVGGTLQ